MFRSPIRLLIPLALLLLAAPAWGHFSALSSNEFSYCYFSAENIHGEDCQDSEFVQDGDCAAACSVQSSSGDVAGVVAWKVVAEAEVQHQDYFTYTLVDVEAARTAPDTLTISGVCDRFGGVPEVAVFRYDGDPAAFDGTAALTVYEFVDMGLIAEQDVLFVYDCPGGPPFSADIDVTGLADSELIVFACSEEAAGDDTPWPDVPALTHVGTAVLALVLLGVGSIVLRKNRLKRLR